jgi:hypothetical protein
LGSKQTQLNERQIVFNFYPWKKIQINDIALANGIATLNFPTGGVRYRNVGFEIGDAGAANGNAPAMTTLAELSLKLGSGIQRRLSGSKLDFLNALNGSQYAARDSVTGGANGTGRKQFKVFFEEPWRKRNDYANGLAWQTGWLGKNDVFQARLDLSGMTSPVISAWAIVDDFSEGKPHNIVKMFEETDNVTSATYKSTKLFAGMPENDLISQISFFNTTPNARTITKGRLKISGVDKFDDVTYQQNFTDLLGADMNPAAGAFHFVFDQDDLFESLVRVGDIKNPSLELTLSAAETGSINWITQRLGLPE